MKIGQTQEKKEEPKNLSEDLIREKIRQHAKSLEENIKKTQVANSQLNALAKQQAMLEGAIRGLQDLLPKGKDEETVKTNSAPVDGQDVPPANNPEPCSDEKSDTGTEKVAGSSERQEPEAEVQPAS